TCGIEVDQGQGADGEFLAGRGGTVGGGGGNRCRRLHGFCFVRGGDGQREHSLQEGVEFVELLPRRTGRADRPRRPGDGHDRHLPVSRCPWPIQGHRTTSRRTARQEV